MQMQISNELVEQYKNALPERIHSYLNQRCIPDEIISKFKIGWNGYAITIPIFNKDNEPIFFKYRKDPEDKSDKAKYWYDAGAAFELYGWENIDEPVVVLCEGELDRLVLESQGIPAITSTGGAYSFNDEWVEVLKQIPNLYLCYDKGVAGANNTEKILEKLPNAKHISLSLLPEGHKDITDFFVLGHKKDDFSKLMKSAKTLDTIKFYNSCFTDSEVKFFNPSQDFIDNVGYFAIPTIEFKKDAKNPIRTVYYVMTSNRNALVLNNESDFYDKNKLLIKQMPSIKNPETRWPRHLMAKYVLDGYTPESKSVFDRVKDVFLKYTEIKDIGWYDILPLWVIGTYFYTVFETYPYLALEGIKGTGKSKALRITTRMAFNGMLSAGLTEASLFRDVESLRCTLGIDEAESLKDPEKSQMLRALLNIGYYKGAKVPRQEKSANGQFFTRYYEVFSPKIIGNTRGLEDTLESRTIKIIMLRAKSNKGNILDTETSEKWNEIRHNCYCFALSYFKEIRNIYMNDPNVKIANNRHNDLWCPLLSIAKLIFKDDQVAYMAIKDFALEQVGVSQEDSLDSKTTALLFALRDLTNYEDAKPSGQDIQKAMGIYLEDKEMENLTTKWIGWKIKHFNLAKNKQRIDKGYIYHFSKSDVQDLIERYLEPSHVCQEKTTGTTETTGTTAEPVVLEERM